MHDAPLEIGRFAPSTTGPAHLGTLLSALLCWLDARSRGARVELRLEDLDPERCREEYSLAMIRDLEWLGLEWDGVSRQRDARPQHEAALDRLADAGRLYPCGCSRARIRDAGQLNPDGGFRYPNWCRERALPTAAQGGWRACSEPLRVRLPEGVIAPADEAGLDLSQDPSLRFGDPIVRRRDGAIAYHLASVVDDANAGVTRIVRGRDLAASSATQARLRELLSLTHPIYHHHLLLLERRDHKLAKLHGALPARELERLYGPAQLCGLLAFGVRLTPEPEPTTPAELIEGFAWSRVCERDRLAILEGDSLHFFDPADQAEESSARP